MLDFLVLSHQCASAVDVKTMAALVRVESRFNPYAIGVVNGRLERQPKTLPEAVATAKFLEENGYNYSVGLAQINHTNFASYGLDLGTAFEPCANLGAGSRILTRCFETARGMFANEQNALRAALSCYYSGNFVTGFQQGYVQRVVNNAVDVDARPIPIVHEDDAPARAGTATPRAAVPARRGLNVHVVGNSTGKSSWRDRLNPDDANVF